MKYLFLASFLFLLISATIFAQKISKEFQGTWYIDNMSTDGGQTYSDFETQKIVEVYSDKIILKISDNKDSVTLNIDGIEQKVIDNELTAYLIWFKNDNEIFEIITDGQNYLLIVGDRKTQQELGRFDIGRNKKTLSPAFNKPQVDDGT